ncbi:hypothetical protein A5882_003568 [Enterococcus sp. 4E1_DIV0656]|uniref:hypothetical protein n=1 Tax=Enterococcus sp. 4E1_DIV0656 TaxID=1834180 RepID=UPI000A35EAFD|nr:hypothetical protein [Enterococcus sp. 4E1_DIV0656]OTO09235.1 hypothetical protein A5882_003568 [Enterococcus sp. 4E1_DIV0656]
MVRRTKKEFSEYNQYHDRPFPLKWGTAYAMDELVKGIKENEKNATKSIKSFDQMTREEIDDVLSEAFLKNKKVSIQLNTRDNMGRLLESIEGGFYGEAYEDYFVCENRKFKWEDIRHIHILDQDKWFKVSVFDLSTKKPLSKKINKPEVELIKDETYQDFYEE